MSALPSKADMCSAHGNVTDSQEWLRTRIRAAGGITCLRFCGNSQTPRSVHAARVSMFCDSSRNCRRRILPTLVFISGHAAAAPIELKSRRVLPSANSPTYFHVDLVIHSARYRVRENDYGGLVRVAELVDRTPTSRNRYVDFLRAMSMLVVIVGHWLAAAPYFDATNTLTASHILAVVPWTAWLTWIVQVMPIFFMVGGYAN